MNFSATDYIKVLNLSATSTFLRPKFGRDNAWLYFIYLSKGELWCFLLVSLSAMLWKIIVLSSFLVNDKKYFFFRRSLYLPCIKKDLLSRLVNFYNPPHRIGLYIYYLHKFKTSRVRLLSNWYYFAMQPLEECNLTREP